MLTWGGHLPHCARSPQLPMTLGQWCWPLQLAPTMPGRAMALPARVPGASQPGLECQCPRTTGLSLPLAQVLHVRPQH